jgi:hypothetical protein
MIKNFLNWIKNIFNPEKREPHLVMYDEVEREETAKQKKIRLKHKGDIK